MASQSRYERILTKVFSDKFVEGTEQVDFVAQDLIDAADQLGIRRPSNLPDVTYSFRYRRVNPCEIAQTEPEGKKWIIRGTGRGSYRFVLVSASPIAPNPNLAITKIPDATPGIVMWHAVSDEQALLARVRYNRLVDVFLGIACYSLQNHLRTSVSSIGQVETDEVYVGIDKRGAHYVIPVQAKSERGEVGRVQLEQDIALCAEKWGSLVCRPMAAQAMADDVIALFEFELQDDEVKIVSEKHYQLVDPDDMTDEDLRQYRQRPID